jgi:hypothetical protein
VAAATFGQVSRSDVELWRGIQNKHEGCKQITFNHWLPKAGDGVSPFSGGKGRASADRPGNGGFVLVAAILVPIASLKDTDS